MRFFLELTLCLLLPSIGIVAQPSARGSFAELERQVKSQQGGWNGDKSKLSAVFDKERRELGENFESELLQYVAGDPEKHYWISFFLENPGYLHGNRPLPQFALLLMEQGLSLLREKSDSKSVGLTVSFNVVAAIKSQELGFSNLALSHKQAAELLLSKNSSWMAYFPAMTEDELRVYDIVPYGTKTVRSSIPGDVSSDRPKTRVSAGVLNGRATSLPIPRYPQFDGKATGEVVVSIVFDETGKVIWAHAISGHPLLQNAAKEAALKATFPPFQLEGKPEKVGGVLIYNFVR